MLVVAGAGTGKTLVLTNRIAKLISEGHARPEEILALTYTENAAQELRERVEKLVGKPARKLHASTFHAYGYGLLSGNGCAFKVLTREDLWVFLRRKISLLNLRQFIKAANPGEFLDDLLAFFDRCHDELVGASQYHAYVERVRAGEVPLPRVASSKQTPQMSREEALSRCDELAQAYITADRLLTERGLGTFGHMISRAVELLHADTRLLERERQHARFILIDEFQDSNVGQIQLAQLLAGGAQDIFAVGDPDQAIYRFRGATSGAFDEFLRRFPNAKMVTLERNYRSTQNVLSCAFAVISRNPPIVRPEHSGELKLQRHALHSALEDRTEGANQTEATPVHVVLAAAPEAEAADIADSIQRMRKAQRARWSEFAVLYRTHRHRTRLTQELNAREIPFTVAGFDVLDTTPVRDLLALLRALARVPDDAASLLRVAALPPFHLHPERLRRAFVEAGRDAVPADAIASVPGGTMMTGTLERVREAITLQPLSMTALFDHVIRSFDLNGEHPGLTSFREFVSQWERKPTTERGDLAEFLEYLDYFVAAGGAVPLKEAPEQRDAVQLLTAHAAKGLEFRHVFVIRLNTSSFPTHYREPLFAFPNALRHSAVEVCEEKSLHLQEERRLLYVAMTRAKDSLALYAKAGKGKDSTPSGFLRELLKERSVGNALSCRTAQALQIDLPVPVPPETISSVAPWILMPAREALKSMTLSATAIDMYERCPLQFKIAHDWRLPGEAVAAMHFGSAMHSALKNYFDVVRSGKTPSSQEALIMFEQALAAMPVEEKVQRELYLQQGRAQLRAFVDSLTSAPAAHVLDTERSFRVEVGGTMVTGRVDRLDSRGADVVAITDYKTGSPRSQEDADDSLQLSLYALAAKRAWNFDPQVLIFYNLETNVAVETSRSPEQLRVAEERVRDVAQNIAAGIFDARPGAVKCRACPYRNLCPATEQKLYSIERTSFATASRVN
jgi:DNA helicase-2/ATP-dependent DNA helicase PcrA